MARVHRLSRRELVFDLGGGGVAVAILGACSVGGGSGPSTTAPTSTGLVWNRVNLGFVSAYVLVHGNRAAVVDTGITGSADAIGRALQSAGSSWDAVSDVVLTHHHPDHAGRLGEVATRAAGATIHAGDADIANLTSPRTVVAAPDGAEVFGLQVVATPGHTAGHVCLFDRTTKVLVAGDALSNTAGLAGSPPQLTADATAARESVKKLATIDAAVILFGHGDPLTADAADALRTYAATL
jgi:glyoxylase-like metal-dependent hydrolase (beta-lactamase superfamily II)